MFKEINNKIQLTFPQRHLQLHLQDSRDSYKCFGYTQFKKMFCKSPIHFWLLQPTDNFLINKKERKAVIVTAVQLRAPTEDTSSVPTFFFQPHSHYTSIQVVAICSLNKASIHSFFSYTEESLSKWTQVTIRKPSYLSHVAGFNFLCVCFQFQRILWLIFPC